MHEETKQQTTILTTIERREQWKRIQYTVRETAVPSPPLLCASSFFPFLHSLQYMFFLLLLSLSLSLSLSCVVLCTYFHSLCFFLATAILLLLRIDLFSLSLSHSSSLLFYSMYWVLFFPLLVLCCVCVCVCPHMYSFFFFSSSPRQ